VRRTQQRTRRTDSPGQVEVLHGQLDRLS